MWEASLPALPKSWGWSARAVTCATYSEKIIMAWSWVSWLSQMGRQDSRQELEGAVNSFKRIEMTCTNSYILFWNTGGIKIGYINSTPVNHKQDNLLKGNSIQFPWDKLLITIRSSKTFSSSAHVFPSLTQTGSFKNRNINHYNQSRE